MNRHGLLYYLALLTGFARTLVTLQKIESLNNNGVLVFEYANHPPLLPFFGAGNYYDIVSFSYLHGLGSRAEGSRL